MLESLDVIDWQLLGYPEMPKWIRGICSQSRLEQEESYNHIYDNNVCSLSKASPHVVPLLIEILTLEQVEKKENVFLLLMQLAGDSSAYLNSEHWHSVAKKTFEALEAGTDIYLNFLVHQQYLSDALWLLGYLKNKAEYIIPRLIEFDQSHPFMKSSLVGVIGMLAADNPHLYVVRNYTDYLIQIIEGEVDDVLLRVVTSLALIKILKTETPAVVDTIIINELINPSPVPHSPKYPRSNLARTIPQLGTERVLKILIQSLPLIHDAQDFHDLLPVALNLAFNDGKIVSYGVSKERLSENLWKTTYSIWQEKHKPYRQDQALTPIQRDLLKAIVENDAVWVESSNIFTLHGLPTTRTALAQLLHD